MKISFLGFCTRIINEERSNLMRVLWWHFLVQSQTWKHWSNVSNLFKVTIKTPERHQWSCFGIFIVNSEQILCICSVLPLMTLNKKMSVELLLARAKLFSHFQFSYSLFITRDFQYCIGKHVQWLTVFSYWDMSSIYIMLLMIYREENMYHHVSPFLLLAKNGVMLHCLSFMIFLIFLLLGP